MIEGGLPVEIDAGVILSLKHAYLQASVLQRAALVEIASRVSVSLVGTFYGSLCGIKVLVSVQIGFGVCVSIFTSVWGCSR